MKTNRLAPLGNEPHSFECVVLQRDKQTKPYYEIARFACSGQSCLASQEEHVEKLMGWPEDFLFHTRLYKVVGSNEWAAKQAQYLLAGMKKRKGQTI